MPGAGAASRRRAGGRLRAGRGVAGRPEPVRLASGPAAGLGAASAAARLRAGGGFGGGGCSAATRAALNAAVSYAKAHGGGTIGVESQSSASAAILSSNADVAGLGGFSGRESSVTAAWLAMEVRAGRLRWIVPDGTEGFGGSRRHAAQGSEAAFAIAEQVGRKVTFTSNGTQVTMYDLQGKAAAILAAAGQIMSRWLPLAAVVAAALVCAPGGAGGQRRQLQLGRLCGPSLRGHVLQGRRCMDAAPGDLCTRPTHLLVGLGRDRRLQHVLAGAGADRHRGRLQRLGASGLQCLVRARARRRHGRPS